MKYIEKQRLAGFIVERAERVAEIDADAYVLRHERTGARLLYLDSADDNKVFSVTFRTPPTDSTGVAHILEHSVLCGSDRYPLREPFVELVKGSLNTFLNAMTYPDKTMYPVASRNLQDFRNLTAVYLDAVFAPAMREDPYILMQEGWHYDIEDPAAPLVYNGVVYNEMKGALSSPDDVLQQRAMELLFPDTTYGVESGGDPEHIPELTFAAFRDFYRQHYHPSNAYFFLYGDLPLEETLAYIHDEYLSHFTQAPAAGEIATQAPLAERVTAVYEYGVAAEDSLQGKSLHALEIAFPAGMQPAEILGMKVLSYVLAAIPGAPLKERIIAAGLGTDISAAFIESLKQPVWHWEVVGSEREQQAAVLQALDDGVAELVRDGIPAGLLEAALNRFEFSLRENDFQGRPKGLYYNIAALNYWLYDEDPLAGLRYEDDLRTLRNGLTNGFFTELLQKYYLDNTHQAAVTMAPAAGLTEAKEAAEAARLAAVKEGLSSAEVDALVAQTKTLRERQRTPDTEEHLATIPLLKKEDLPHETDDDSLTETSCGGRPLYGFTGETHGIIYANLYFDLADLTAEEFRYTVLLADLAGMLATEHYGYGELAQAVDRYTGGIQVGMELVSHYLDDTQVRRFVTVRGKALTAHAEKLIELTDEIINRTQYTDTNRLGELLREKKSDWDLQLFRMGNSLMMNRALSYVSPYERWADETRLSYYAFLQEVLRQDPAAVAQRLTAVARRVFRRDAVLLQVTGGEEEMAAAQRLLPGLLANLASEPCGAATRDLPLHTGNEAFLSVGKVQYVAQGGNFRRAGFEYSGSLEVMAGILRYDYLWQQVRVLGGAYGAHVQISATGNTVFCSYRDPNLKETLDVYAAMPQAMAAFDVTERMMRQYVIGALAPTQTQFTLPMRAQRAMRRLLGEMPRSYRQRIREELISCTQADIRATAPLLQAVIDQQRICVMGSESKIHEQQELFRDIISFGE
ncbi:MAG: insulinase family protein [Veillonellaceae bacterium]|nr:insulinase family protein [Veillonellaceae bacterium]